MLYFKIKLEKDMSGNSIIVQEYHKGRREPYPKVIKVYEKQKVEIFDSKYFLSLYDTEKSYLAFLVDSKQIHFKSHQHDNSDGDSI
jgi:hypothetical protein